MKNTYIYIYNQLSLVDSHIHENPFNPLIVIPLVLHLPPVWG